MKSPPGRFVIFDVDGTLVDSRPAIVASIRHVQTRRGMKPSDSDELRWALGPPLADVMRRLLPGADDAAIAEAVATYREHNAFVCTAKATLYEGIRSALAELAVSGYTLKGFFRSPLTVSNFEVRHDANEPSAQNCAGDDAAGNRLGGLDFRVVMDAAAAGEPTFDGTYDWYGAAGTWFWIPDAAELAQPSATTRR